MADCIRREEALDFLIPAFDLNISAQDKRAIAERFEEFLESIPAADVAEVVRGSWEWEMYQVTPHCSVCGGKGKPGPAIEERFSFCPWCGADMREDNIKSISKIHEQLKGVQERGGWKNDN